MNQGTGEVAMQSMRGTGFWLALLWQPAKYYGTFYNAPATKCLYWQYSWSWDSLDGKVQCAGSRLRRKYPLYLELKAVRYERKTTIAKPGLGALKFETLPLINPILYSHRAVRRKDAIHPAVYSDCIGWGSWDNRATTVPCKWRVCLRFGEGRGHPISGLLDSGQSRWACFKGVLVLVALGWHLLSDRSYSLYTYTTLSVISTRRFLFYLSATLCI